MTQERVRRQERGDGLQAVEVILGVLARRGHPSEAEAEQAFLAGARQLPTPSGRLTLPGLPRLGVLQLGRSLDIALTEPLAVRQRIIRAAEAVVLFDGRVQALEAELTRMLALCLHVTTFDVEPRSGPPSSAAAPAERAAN